MIIFNIGIERNVEVKIIIDAMIHKNGNTTIEININTNRFILMTTKKKKKKKNKIIVLKHLEMILYYNKDNIKENHYDAHSLR